MNSTGSGKFFPPNLSSCFVVVVAVLGVAVVVVVLFYVLKLGRFSIQSVRLCLLSFSSAKVKSTDRLLNSAAVSEVAHKLVSNDCW